MKKLSILLLVIVGCAYTASADELEKVKNRRAFNISYVSDKISVGDVADLSDAWQDAMDIVNEDNGGIRNNWGIAISQIRTYRLHKRPIARLLSFGIDASFFDVTYSNYTLAPAQIGGDIHDGLFDFITGSASRDLLAKEADIHKVDYSLQVGPTLMITPGQSVMVSVYARYAPSFSCMFNPDFIAGNFANYFVGGASVNYKTFGVGIEARTGSAKYNHLKGDLDFSADKIKTSGFRVYVQFRW